MHNQCTKLGAKITPIVGFSVLNHQTTFWVKNARRPFFALGVNYHPTTLEHIVNDCDKTLKDINIEIGTQVENITVQHVDNHFWVYSSKYYIAAKNVEALFTGRTY